jgi:cytochrome P450
VARTPAASASTDPRDFAWPSPEVSECPFPFYDALRESGGVYHHEGHNEYLVSRWEDIAYVTEHPELFKQAGAELFGDVPEVRPQMFYGDQTDQRYTPQSMAGSDPPEHRIKRLLGLRMVARERLRAYEPQVRRSADDLIDAFIDRGAFEFHEQFSVLLPIVVIVDILGLPRADLALFQRWGTLDGPVAFRFMDEAEVGRQMEYGGEAAAYMEAAIQERVANPREDFLSELIQAQVEQDGELALDYINAEANLLLYAGNVTTTHMMTSAMQLLIDNPEQMRAVLEDRALIKPLIEEALRVESPVQWLVRIATTDVELGGVTMPAGAMVVIVLASANRDPAKFGGDAADFCVHRRDVAKHHVAFGRGTHLCVGAPLARLEGRIAFEQLLERLPGLRAAPGKNSGRHIKSLAFRAPEALHLEF